MMSRVQCCHPFFGVIKNPQKMELSCHFFWLLRPQIEWTIKCHKKKSLGSIRRALEWAIKVESEKPGDSKTYINDTQQQPHLLKRSDGGRKRLLHYSTLCAKKVLFCSDILKVFPDEENLSLINSGQFVYRTFLEHFNQECFPTPNSICIQINSH